uniref:peptidylprolyl isomerase n=1 Tax=Tetraselmis sp. GSL018 TaxID=582737 RepID=A0A061S496_9CHLO|eukprot:CAMPEP_0177606400 /NCGR_PEP_ID=MMETSP0419_2-20121207/17286_1 /TAXON_ID=582737 /ORGANISM="Tetraselmis sp., Strain GSL018" /LENGTH=538 /DNA_ID=CAMNT_0019100757 /DNA_START=106 /DNA_END=1722 /DNA_ORIENTATION=-
MAGLSQLEAGNGAFSNNAGLRTVPSARLFSRRPVPTTCQRRISTSKPNGTPRKISDVKPLQFALRSTGASSSVVLAAASEEVVSQEISNENAHVSFKVTVSPEFCKRCYNKTLEDARATADIPGYRKGATIPEKMLVGYLGGKREVTRLAVERTLRDSMPQALASIASQAISDSERIESSAEELISSFSTAEPFVYQVGVDLPPKIRFAVPYKNIKVAVPSCSSPETEAKQVEDLILQGRKDNGFMRIPEGRAMQKGDVVIIDLELYEKGASEPIPGATRKGYRIDTGRSNAVFLPGVIQGMEGMATGEERTVPIRFPDDWEPPQLAGKEHDAKLRLKELFTYDLAPEDDALAASLDPSAKSMAELREKLAKAVTIENEMINRSRVDAAITEELVQITDVDLPYHIVQTVAQQKYQAKIMELQSKGQISPEVMEKLATAEMLQNYINTNRDEVESSAKAMLAVETIFKLEKLSVSEEEKQARVRETMEDMEREGLEYDREELLQQAEDMLVTEKALEWLRANCSVTMQDYDPELEERL